MNSTAQKMKQSSDLQLLCWNKLERKNAIKCSLSTSKASIRTYTLVVHQLLFEELAVEKCFVLETLEEICVECCYGYFPYFSFHRSVLESPQERRTIFYLLCVCSKQAKSYKIK